MIEIEIPTGWRETTLGEVAEIKTGVNIPTRLQKREGKYKIIGANGVIGYLDNFLIEGSFIFTGRVGTIGEVNFKEGKMHPSDNVMYLYSDKKYKTKFLYYYLKKQNLKSLNVGSTQPLIKQSDLKKYPILLPPLPEQEAIAKVLGSLDDKIELLREQNETLEQMGQELFKEWFGRYSPDRPEELPEGWRVGKIYEYLDILYGYPFKSKLFNTNGEGYPIIRIRDLKEASPDIYSIEEVDPQYEIIKGDILAGMDAEFRPVIWKGRRALLNQRVCKFIPKNGANNLFILEFMRPWLDFYEKTKVGTTVSHLGKKDLDFIDAVLPDKLIVQRFSQHTEVIFKKILNNYGEIQSLSATRDALLPKLMSGEVRVEF